VPWNERHASWECSWSKPLDFLKAKTMSYFLFDKSLLPLGCGAAPKPDTAIIQIHRIIRIYDCFAAERGGAAVRQAPSPQWICGAACAPHYLKPQL
jgi:hypothetical protein